MSGRQLRPRPLIAFGALAGFAGLVALFGVVLQAACGADPSPGLASAGADGGYSGGAGKSCRGANDCAPGQFCNAFGYCAAQTGSAGDAGAPPEVETKASPPAAGKRYLYVAVPEQQMVARIDSKTLGVASIRVGLKPTALRTVDGEDIAVVINTGSSTASVIRTDSAGKDTVVTLVLPKGLNQLAMAPDGDFAVAYFDVSRAGGKLPATSLQEAAVIALVAGKEKATRVAVGFRPREVQFSRDGAQAFVVGERSVTIIDFAKLAQKPLPERAALTRKVSEVVDEVEVTSDGKLALVRLDKGALLRVVELQADTITDITLAGRPTDLDVTKDGKLALLALRDQHKVAVVDLPGDISTPSGIETISTGDLAPGQIELLSGGKRALLFSNAVDQEELAVLDLVKRASESLLVKKGIVSVTGAKDGKTAVVIHNKKQGTPSSSDPLETYIDKSYGYSLIDLSAGVAKLQLTPVAPGEARFSLDSAHAFVLLEGTGVRAVDRCAMRSLIVDREQLGSPPIAVGTMPGTTQVYVAQDHPLGRVTFIDAATGKQRTLTGFALNARVID